MSILTLKSRKQFLAMAAFERLAIFIETLPDRALKALYIWQKRIRDRRHLSQLDDRLLVDMGLDRAYIDREAGKRFWLA